MMSFYLNCHQRQIDRTQPQRQSPTIENAPSSLPPVIHDVSTSQTLVTASQNVNETTKKAIINLSSSAPSEVALPKSTSSKTLEQQVAELQRQVEFYKSEKLKNENELMLLQLKFNQEMKKSSSGKSSKSNKQNQPSQPIASVEEDNVRLRKALAGMIHCCLFFYCQTIPQLNSIG
jgi:regulator of replication initiation timing